MIGYPRKYAVLIASILLAAQAHAKAEVVPNEEPVEEMTVDGDLVSKTSSVDVNQAGHSVYMDEEGTMIEDLAEDPELDADDLMKGSSGMPAQEMQPMDTMLHDMLGIDDMMGDDYVEEHVDAQGHHTRKEVHKGDGWTTVHISSDGGFDGNDIGGLVGGMLEQLMQSQMQAFAGGPAGQLSARPFMGFPDMDIDEEDEHEHEIDPMSEIFQVMEQARRQQEEMMFGSPMFIPGFFSPDIIEIVPDDHALAMVEDATEEIEQPREERKLKQYEPMVTKEEKESKEVTADDKQSSLYMVFSMLLFCGVVIGLYLFVKEDKPAEGDNVTQTSIKMNSFGTDRKLR